VFVLLYWLLPVLLAHFMWQLYLLQVAFLAARHATSLAACSCSEALLQLTCSFTCCRLLYLQLYLLQAALLAALLAAGCFTCCLPY
jgi:uncharacterized MAPEG superfamily protein